MREYVARILLRAQDHHWNIDEREMVIPPEFIMIRNLVFHICTLESGQVGVKDVKENQSRANLILFPQVLVSYSDKKGAMIALRLYIHGLKINSFFKRDFTVDELIRMEERLGRFRKLWNYKLALEYDPHNALRWDIFMEELCLLT